MQQLTHTPTENPSINVHGNQQSIYDINIQRQELDKWMLISNNLIDKLDSQQATNASWLVSTIKAILQTTIQKFEELIFLFSTTHEAAFNNSKVLVVFKGDLGAAIEEQKDRLVNSESGLRNISSVAKLFLHHEDKTKIINIIQKGSRYHLNPIEEEIRKSDLDAMILRENHKSSH